MNFFISGGKMNLVDALGKPKKLPSIGT